MQKHRRFHSGHLHLRVQLSTSNDEDDAASWLLEELRTARDYYRYERALLEVVGNGPVGGPGWVEELAHVLDDLPIKLETVAVRRVSGDAAFLWLLGETRRAVHGAHVRFTELPQARSHDGRIAAVLAGRKQVGADAWTTVGLPSRYNTRFTIAQRAAGRWLDDASLTRLGLTATPKSQSRLAGARRDGRRAAGEARP